MATKSLFRVVGTILVYTIYEELNNPRRYQFLITKRSNHQIVFPGLWTIPGGGLEYEDYLGEPRLYNHPQWYGVIETAMRRELYEETKLCAGELQPITDLVFIQPSGVHVLVLSYMAPYKSGSIELDTAECSEYAWITVEDVHKYKFIHGIEEEIIQANKKLPPL